MNRPYEQIEGTGNCQAFCEALSHAAERAGGNDTGIGLGLGIVCKELTKYTPITKDHIRGSLSKLRGNPDVGEGNMPSINTTVTRLFSEHVMKQSLLQVGGHAR